MDKCPTRTAVENYPLDFAVSHGPESSEIIENVSVGHLFSVLAGMECPTACAGAARGVRLDVPSRRDVRLGVTPSGGCSCSQFSALLRLKSLFHLRLLQARDPPTPSVVNHRIANPQTKPSRRPGS